MATESVIGNLVVRIGGDTKGLVDAVTRADGSLKSIERTAERMSKVLAGALVAGAAAMIALTRSSQNTVDAQFKLAERLDATVLGVQTLSYAADLAGINFEQMSKSADMLNRKLGEAMRDGMSPAADAFKRLGLSARELSKLDADERLAKIADRIKAMGLNGAQAADVLRQMGIRGAEFSNLMRKGGDDIRNARRDVIEFGVAVSDIDAKKIEIANDSITTLGLIATGVGNQIAVALAPAIQAAAEALGDASRNTGGFKGAIETAVDVSVRAFGMLRREIYQVRIGFDELIGDFLDGWDAVAGAVPKLIAKITGKSLSELGFEPINKNFGKLRDTLEKPPSDEEWQKWWQKRKEEADKAAKSAVDAAKELGKGPKGEVLSSQERKQFEEKFQRLQQAIADEDQALKLQREKQLRDLAEFHAKGIISKQKHDETRLQIDSNYQDKMKALIQAKLEEGILTEQELLVRKHALQLEEIRKFEENKTITMQQANELRRKYAEQHSIDMMQVTARQYSGLASIVDTSLSNISGIIKNENSKAFKAMKIISTATALVKGYEAMVSAYAAGAKIGGPALGAAFAAIAAAGTGAIIARIHGVGESSGGTPSAAAASATPAAAAQPANNQYLHVRGIDANSLFSGSQVRELAEQLLQYQRDGGQVVLV